MDKATSLIPPPYLITLLITLDEGPTPILNPVADLVAVSLPSKRFSRQTPQKVYCNFTNIGIWGEAWKTRTQDNISRKYLAITTLSSSFRNKFHLNLVFDVFLGQSGSFRILTNFLTRSAAQDLRQSSTSSMRLVATDPVHDGDSGAAVSVKVTNTAKRRTSSMENSARVMSLPSLPGSSSTRTPFQSSRRLWRRAASIESG